MVSEPSPELPRPQSTGTVGYVFGVLEAAALPGSILVPLLVDLGMSAPAVRTMLHRMGVAGNVVSHRAGRASVYRLAGPYAQRFQRFRSGRPRPVWAGRFQMLLYDIPEGNRRQRDELRDTAFKNGFGAPRPGVLIGFDDPRGWCEPWLKTSSGTVEVVELVCPLPSARRLTERAWALTTVRPALEEFGAQLATVAHVLSQDRYGDQEAFRLQAALWDRWVNLLLRLPTLPSELTPQGWPVADLVQALTALTYQLQPRASAHAHRVVDQSGCADLLELLPGRLYGQPSVAGSRP